MNGADFPNVTPLVVDPKFVRCRNCKLFDLVAVQDSAGRARKDRVARCKWEARIPFPMSTSIGRGYSPVPVGGHMTVEDGEGCKVFVLDQFNCAAGVLPAVMRSNRRVKK